jgi:hypothetical protein
MITTSTTGMPVRGAASRSESLELEGCAGTLRVMPLEAQWPALRIRTAPACSARGAYLRVRVTPPLRLSDSLRARNPRWKPGMGVIPDPRQIGGGSGGGPPIPGKSGVEPPPPIRAGKSGMGTGTRMGIGPGPPPGPGFPACPALPSFRMPKYTMIVSFIEAGSLCEEHSMGFNLPRRISEPWVVEFRISSQWDGRLAGARTR